MHVTSKTRNTNLKNKHRTRFNINFEENFSFKVVLETEEVEQKEGSNIFFKDRGGNKTKRIFIYHTRKNWKYLAKNKERIELFHIV